MALPKQFRSLSLRALSVTLLTLTACGSPVADQPAAQPSASASPITAAANACETLKPAFAEALGLPVAVTDTPFTDITGGMQQQGCQLTAKGTGAQIKDFVGVSQQLSAMLTEMGWGQAEPLADGPTGTVIGFNGGGHLGQLTVEWEPAPTADCPQDKPITECVLLPEQKLYTIKLEAAATLKTFS